MANTRNIFADSLDVGQKVYEAERGYTQDRARIRAGRALSGGNRAQAAQEFGNAGMTDDVRQMQGDQQVVEDRDREAAERRVKLLLGALPGLKTVPLGQRKQALGHPIWAAAGLGPELTDRLTEDHITDENIDMLTGKVEREWQIISNDDGVMAVDKRDPTKRMTIRGARRKPDWKEIKKADGSSTWVDFADDPEGDTPPPPNPPNPYGPDTQAASAGAPRLSGSAGGDRVSFDEQSARSAVSSLLPGARVTSGRRSPDHNRRVGGAARSHHLSGGAIDFVPPAGVSFNQFRAQLQQRGLPVKELIDEGDHWHWAYGGGADVAASGGSDALAGADDYGGRRTRPGSAAQPKAKSRPATEAEKAQYGIAANVPAVMKPDGDIQVINVPGDDKKTAPAEGAKKVAGFGYRLIKANERLNNLAQEGIVQPSALQLATDGKGVRRFAIDKMAPNDRRFISAAKDWLAPILRRDSGAAVSDEEILTYMDMYIPQPGDPPQLLREKAEARKVAMDTVVLEEKDLLTKTYGNQKYNVRFAPERKGAGRPPLDSFRN